MDDILMIASVAVTLFGVFMLRYKRFRRLRHYIGWYFLIVGCVMLLRITLFPQAPLAFGRLSYNILVIGHSVSFPTLSDRRSRSESIDSAIYSNCCSSCRGSPVLSGTERQYSGTRFGIAPGTSPLMDPGQPFRTHREPDASSRFRPGTILHLLALRRTDPAGPQTSRTQKMALRLSGGYRNDHAVLQFMVN